MRKLRNNHIVYGGRHRARAGRIGRLQVVHNVASEKRQVLRESGSDKWLEQRLYKQFRFTTHLSRFRANKFRSTPSMRMSNSWAIACCLSSGWDRMMFSLSCLPGRKNLRISLFSCLKIAYLK
jgi:hypothetical protein